MTTTRLTFGAVLDTVQNTAGTVNAVLNTVTTTVNMGNKYVTDAAEKQRLRSIVDMHDYKQILVEEKSMEAAQRQKKIVEMCKQDPTIAQLFAEQQSRILEILN